MNEYILVYLLNDGDYMFFDEQIDGVHKADIDKIDAQIYVQANKLDDFCESMIISPYGAYLIPSEYTGEIVLADDIEVLAEYPSDFNWGFIEDCLPNYSSSDEVLLNDFLQRYVDGELSDTNDAHIIEMCEDGCPSYLTASQWVHHKLAYTNTLLFNEALKANKIK